jgi:hypothetical protein
VAILVADAERREDVNELKILKELHKTRRALRRYLNAHVFAVQSVGTKNNPIAGERFWRAYEGAWRSLGEKPVMVEQFY